MNLDPIETMAARAALKDMVRKGYFSICTVKDILAMGNGVPPAKEWKILKTLHCVNFSDMEPELRRGLPVLIARVLDCDSLELSLAVSGTSLRLVG